MLDALELLWPTTCAGCDAPGGGRVCPACRATLQPEALRAPIPCVRGGLAASRYAAPPARILRIAKYGPDPQLMRVLGRAFAASIRESAAAIGADVIVPAPSPWNRRLRRGFAPAAVLADGVARVTGVPVLDALALRPGPRQAGLHPAARAANARRRIHLRGGALPSRILLVDDVLTTGATVAACATELLGGGAREVWVAALSVATRDGQP
jgi:predicted amidophosphoribosyltransferase